MTDSQKFLNDLKTGVRYVVINDCHGGFGLSDAAVVRYMQLIGQTEQDFAHRDLDRDDPYLVQVVKEMGDAASGPHAKLKIVEIPGDVDWFVSEYDGAEWIAEKHRTWS
jgi:hypothetical protein